MALKRKECNAYMCCYLIFICPTSRIRVCEIRFVSTGEKCGKPCNAYMRCYSIFIHPTGRIRICAIRFVSTGEKCGKPCLVCKKELYLWVVVVTVEPGQ